MRFEFNLRRLTDKSWKNPRLHFHDMYEVLFSLTDAGNLFAGNELFPLERGTLCLIRNGVLHRTICKVEEFERYVLQFPESTIQELLGGGDDMPSVLPKSYISAQLDGENYEQLKLLFERLYRLPSDALGNRFHRNVTFLEILYLITSILGEQPEQGEPVTSPNYNRIRPVLNYIQAHLEDPLTLDTLSHQFYLSKHYFCHLFREATGFSITEYIIHSRIVRARALLRSGVSVQEAGERSGFRNNSHFIKTFTKTTNISPGRYAREYRSSNKI